MALNKILKEDGDALLQEDGSFLSTTSVDVFTVGTCALMMSVVLASWPSGNLQALTRGVIIQGSVGQPPPVCALSPESFTAIRSWDIPNPPTQGSRVSAATVPPPVAVQDQPYSRPRYDLLAIAAEAGPVLYRPPVKIAPLTLATGDQPPPKPPLAQRIHGHIVSTWAQTWDAQTHADNAGWNVPPILSAVASGVHRTILTSVIGASWPTGNLRALTRGVIILSGEAPVVQEFVPYTRPRYDIITANLDTCEPCVVTSYVIAPESSDPPPRQFALSRQALAVTLQAWQPDPITPQAVRATAAWQVPPVQTFVPGGKPYLPVYLAHIPDGLAVGRLRSVVPTFAAVSQPTPNGPLALRTLLHVVSMWVQTWEAQTASKNAAINPPPVLTLVPRTTLPQSILTAWETPWIKPPAPVVITPLTLTYGAQPTPQPPLSASELNFLVGAWTQTWDAQTYAKNAAWNVPPILVSLPYVPLPKLIWTAWEPPFVAPPRPVAIAPLTLPTGAPPPPYSAATIQLTAAAAWALKPETPQRAIQTAAWNIPLLVQVPSVRLPLAIRAAWEPPFIAPPRPVGIAPLSLVYGQAPPVQPPLNRTSNLIILRTWPLDLEPRRDPPQPLHFTRPSLALPPYLSADEFFVATWTPLYFIATWTNVYFEADS